MLRIDRTVAAAAFRGTTLSILEVEALTTIKDVVRKEVSVVSSAMRLLR